MATRNASSRKTENQPPRPLTIVETGNTPLIGAWSIDTRLTRGTHSRSRSNSYSRSRDHRDKNVGPIDIQLKTERGKIRAAISVIGREMGGQASDRANLDIQSIHGNVQVTISRDAGRRFRLTASSDTGCVVIVLPPDFVGTITHGERTSFSARAFRLVRLGATVATMPTNWLNRPSHSHSGSISNPKGSSNSRVEDNNRRSGSETVTTRGMRHLSVERDGTLRASDAVEVRAGRNVRIIVSGEPLWHANPLVARVMGMFMKH